jgi:O-antigen/teichoic acid export membrane protein
LIVYPLKSIASVPAVQPVSVAIAAETEHDEYFGTSHLRANLGSRALSGGIVTTVSQGARFALYLALTVILSRMLTPEDVGLVAMALALMTILHMFRDIGLSTATVQQEKITHAQVSNLFWINLAIGLSATLLSVVLAPIMAWYYREPRLLMVTISLSVTLLAGAAAVQHLAILNRQMRFRALAWIDVASMLMSLVVGVGMAALQFGYWSLVGAQLAQAFTELLMAWGSTKWRPRAPSRKTGTRSMLNFGASLTLAMLLRRITSNVDQFLIGRYAGAHGLGLYSRAMALVMRPLDQFLVPFDKVFVPILSRLQDDPERYRRNFLQIYGTMALVSFPVAGLLLGLSGPLVLLLLGPRWVEVTPIFAALTLAALYYPVACASMWLLTTQRRNQDILVSGGVISAIAVVSCLVGLPFGPWGVALSFSIFGIFIRLPFQYYIVGRSGPVRTRDLWKIFFSHLPFWLIVSAGAYAPQMLFPHRSSIEHILLGVGAGAALGLGLAASSRMYRGEVMELWNRFKEFTARRRAALAA